MIVALLALALAANAEEIPKGKLVEKVVSQADATQSYALYLPSSYDPSRKWPILYCFDPIARGRVPVELFREGAEKYGYIVAGSNNSRNGPWEPTLAAIHAMGRDTTERFSVDLQRVHTAGFSGGARVASRVALDGSAVGVIACGGGFPASATPKAVPFAFFGTAGTDDFNYHELRHIDSDLHALGAAHLVAVFSGGHDWLPAALATEAIGWLELQAMREGLRPTDEALRRERLAAVAQIEKQTAELTGSRQVRDWAKKEAGQETRQTEMATALFDLGEGGALGALRGTVNNLRKKGDAPQDSPERRLARRVLNGAFVEASEMARDRFERKEYDRAAAMLEVMAALRPARADTFYSLARARALTGESKKALAALKQAGAAGFKDAPRLAQDEAFASLRASAAFQLLLTAMK